MKKSILLICICICICICIMGLSTTGFAGEKKIRIEVLQVADIVPYQKSYMGFIRELEKNGFVQGKNLDIHRTIIGFDIENGGLWKKMGVLIKIRSEASSIIDARPDLVLTIGTPATKHAKDKIISAGIPLVFTAVAIPQAVGCNSMTDAGPGFTGATLHMDMKNALQIIRLAFPKVKTIGIVYSDDENAIAHVEEAKNYGLSAGFSFITKEISKNDKLTPSLQELQKNGAEVFLVTLDTYYGLRNYEPCTELEKFSVSTKIPFISLALTNVRGGVLYVGSDFGTIGELSAQQAVKIIKNGVKPETLPILKQDELKILVDTKQLKALNFELPLEILTLAKDIE